MDKEDNYNYTPLKEPIPITEQQWPEGTIPLVTTRTITYMHEHFIRECIESILMQKTNFPVEVIIHDDASTDKTADIMREYQVKHPRLIKAIYQEENQYSKPLKGNIVESIQKLIQGKYIALCEGDDYWTDPLKLQKQVDFLERNTKYVLCFHNAEIKHENNSLLNKPFCDLDKTTFTIEDVITRRWFIPTQSIVYKRDLLDVRPTWMSYVYNGDLALQLMLADKGNFYYFDDIMSVYRRHGLSVQKQLNYSEYRVKNKVKEVLLYFNCHSDFKYNNIIQKKLDAFEKESYNALLLERPLFNRLFSLDFYLIIMKMAGKKLRKMLNKKRK